MQQTKQHQDIHLEIFVDIQFLKRTSLIFNDIFKSSQRIFKFYNRKIIPIGQSFMLFQFLNPFKIMRSRLKIVLTFAFGLVWLTSTGQLKDTSLFTMYSRPFFFNVVKEKGGDIFAGTSEGIYRMEGSNLVKVNSRVGYLLLDKEGKPAIDSNGIKYHAQKSVSHLLPYPDEIRDEYHAGTEDFFYITAGGKMHVFEILPYAIQYRNHSVRTVSEHFTGTYSGIYYKGKKLTDGYPNFSDGYIREINGKAFICYSSLIIADLSEDDSIPRRRKDLPPGMDFNYVSDILYSKLYRRYYLATKTQLGAIDLSLTRSEALYTIPENSGEVELLGEDRSTIVFAAGRKLIRYYTRDTIRTLATLPEPILDGHISTMNYFLLGASGLYVKRSDDRVEKLIDLKKAHTILPISDAAFAIATDIGLFLYNAASGKLSELVRGVEFNRRGLHLKGDHLYACSINGVYVLDARNLEQLAERVGRTSGNRGLPAFIIPLVASLVLISLGLSILVIRYKRRLNRILEEVKEPVSKSFTKEDVETFIRENLALASLKSVSDHFQTTNAVIYTLLAPEKPGAFINRLRMDEVIRMRKEKKTAREISEQTGFSESYVRKVWNQTEA
jgi:hypothetical protein